MGTLKEEVKHDLGFLKSAIFDDNPKLKEALQSILAIVIILMFIAGSVLFIMEAQEQRNGQVNYLEEKYSDSKANCGLFLANCTVFFSNGEYKDTMVIKNTDGNFYEKVG